MHKKTHPFETLERFINLGDRPEDWTKFCERYPTFFPTTNLKQLSSFQERLRSAWSRSDGTGTSLLFLLGLEVSKALPKGQPKADPLSGRISFGFTCEFQQQVHDLLCTGENWKAMRCLKCGRFFVATKTAQKHCGPECYLAIKREKSLTYWRTKGEKIRKAKRGVKHGK